MVVTFDVSKLSGWLNAAAYCRESKGGHKVRGEVRAGRQEGDGCLQICRQARGGHLEDCSGQEDCSEDCSGQGRARAERTSNIWFMFVTPEVFQLEMSALKFIKR